VLAVIEFTLTQERVEFPESIDNIIMTDMPDTKIPDSGRVYNIATAW